MPMTDALLEIPPLRDRRPARPHLARPRRRPRARSGARPTCATATRRSSSRWTRRASRRCSTCSSRSASRRSRSASRRRRRPTSTSCGRLVEDDLIPADTTIAVLTQARPELIERTYEAIEGARRAIVHLYNSTSETQRRVVFRLDKDGITDLAVRGTALCKELAAQTDDRDRVRVLARELPRHRARLRARDLRGGDRGVGADDRGADDRQPADDGRGVPAERLRRPARVVPAPRLLARPDHPQRPSAQRPRHRGRDRRARADGRRRARRGDAVRERRAHRQRRHRHARAEPAHAGRRPGLDLSQIDEAKAIVEECNELPVHPRHP